MLGSRIGGGLWSARAMDRSDPSGLETLRAGQDQLDAFRDLRWRRPALGAFSLVALVLTWSYGYALVGLRFQPQTLWAIGIWSAGAAIGFLAIPRVLQGRPVPGATNAQAPASSGSSAPSPAAPVYEQRVNTNLEEISDWLTKIIIGMTLVELKQIPDLICESQRKSLPTFLFRPTEVSRHHTSDMGLPLSLHSRFSASRLDTW